MIAVFSSFERLVSDQGSTFKDAFMDELTCKFHVAPQRTTACLLWPSASVERIYCKVLRACNALLSEWLIASQDWPAMTECIRAESGAAASPGCAEPKQPRSLSHAIRVVYRHGAFEAIAACNLVRQLQLSPTEETVRVQQLISLKTMKSALEDIHRSVAERDFKERKRHVYQHNKRTNVKATRCGNGDFVLVRQVRRMR